MNHRHAHRHELIAALLVPTLLFAQIKVEKDAPHRIMLNLTETPATSMAATWRTLDKVRDAVVEYTEATDGPTFKDQTRSVPASITPWKNKDGPEATWYSAVLTNLRPATVYAYRVGAKGAWSEWNQFRTAAERPEPFTFVFLGDPQNDIRTHVSRIFREAYRGACDARFWLFVGDLTTTPTDDLWNKWFDAAGFINATMPSIMVPGNHDYGTILLAGARIHNNELPLWRTQFTLPENGPPGLEETSYVVDYQGARLVMINSNTKLEEQAAWMDSVLTHRRGTWTIMAFHHPMYSSGGGRDNRRSRDAFLGVFDKHHVDLVLQGHDHTYSRSHKLADGKVVSPNEPGTVYIVSSSGPKMYPLNRQYEPIMAKMAEGVQLYQTIRIDGSTLQYRAITPTGRTHDEFELKK
ncbi:MAG: metallophosphoesterase family protein [Bacteroidetes bacterium]|nr:metallophosphoesterase family protein [Bacteroidota bacterium]